MPGVERPDAARRGAVLAGLIAYALAWMVGLLWSPPVPLYDPVTGTWHVGRVPAALEMVWYGRVALAWAVATPAAALGFAAGRRGVVFGSLWQAWALTAVGLAVALSAVAFWP